MDVHSVNCFKDLEEKSISQSNLMDGFWSSKKYYGYLNTFKYEKEKIMLDKYTIIEKRQTRVFYNWLQFYNKTSIKKEFENYGLKIKKFYSDVAGKPFNPKSKDFAVIAQKK